MVWDLLDRNGFVKISPFHQARNDDEERQAFSMFEEDVAAAREALASVTGVFLSSRDGKSMFQRPERLLAEFSHAMMSVDSGLKRMEGYEAEKKMIPTGEILGIFSSMDRLKEICRMKQAAPGNTL